MQAITTSEQFHTTLVKVEEVAKLFHTTQPKIKAAILNGTLPIGFVADGDVDRIFIVDKRLRAWLNGDDLKLYRDKEA